MARRASNPKRKAWAVGQLEQPAFPSLGGYLWGIYHRIRRRRSTVGGIVPIDFSEFDAFQRSTRTALTPWEIGVLELLDDLYLAARLAPPPVPPEDL